MLDYIEVDQLEKRWQIYKQNSKKKKIKMDLSYIILSTIIILGIITIIWILNSSKSSVKQNNNIVAKTIVKDHNVNQVKKPEILSINDIPIKRSEDSAGFDIGTNVSSSSVPTPVYAQPQQPVTYYRPLPQDEVIDFGRPPSPPSSVSQSASSQAVINQPRKLSPNAIVIQSSNVKDMINDLKQKFNQTKDITYSLMISEDYYKKRDYQNAEKWAVISNDIDKNNAESWMLFAKAKFKQGDKQSAIIALEAFLRSNSSAKASNLLADIKAGSLQ